MTIVVAQELFMHKPPKADLGGTRRSGPPRRSHANRSMPSILDPIEPEEVWEDVERAVEQIVERVVEPVDFPHGHHPDDDDAPEDGRNEITRAAESIPSDSPADRADHSAVREEHPPMPPSIDDILDQDLVPDRMYGARHAGKAGKR
ncbi:hypothetical protein [Cupriavidus oxalaticus]|uniref:Uncharacterized protein n=1 Tax=Cupriavidus oxalaticus TaxID=96344 RepID=A0A4P7LLR3_9BURK|nr:hypothetical protein [Cupriavidus oxalaticus]QBY53101.1 hypothetical protein E0W60_18445 [Cupriavidus oxalaticus]